ncbi:MAG: sensor domain-containing diguanylate cyclase [Oleiphilaceae bacterium]|nr:sensor domain-containing diguanylate cyclase [Oleiphilaceae bacterium]
MSTVDQLIANARKNEVIAQNLFDIEVAIMNITRCSDFFTSLIELVKEKFVIDHVWLCLTDTAANGHLIDTLQHSQLPEGLMRVCTMVDFLQVTKSVKEPVLINRDLLRLRMLVPKELKDVLGSVAILPLVVDSRIVGALMLGAAAQDRYSPKKDSFFLRQLAVKASISLAGVWARERISFLATRDPLTLLRNRRELEESLEQELSRHARQREHLALMFIDCDDFKLVNDTHGHDVGDMYLKHVAHHLNELTRKSDMAFRFAGDEFVVLLPNQRQEGAEVIASRIKEYLLQNPLKHGDTSIPVKLSYGVVSTEIMDKVDTRRMLKAADERLYEMKKLKPSCRTNAPVVADPS